MAKKKVRLSITEYDKLIKKYGTILQKIRKELGFLHTNFDAIQTGDSEGPYWNGAVAKKFYAEAIINIDKDIEAYNALAKVYKSLVQKRRDIKHKKVNG